MQLLADTVTTIFENETENTDQRLTDEVQNLTQFITDYDRYLSVSRDGFRFRHHVGIVQTENYTIQVLPKIWKSDPRGEKHAEGNLMKLLLYAFAPPRLNVPGTDVSLERSDLGLFDLLIRLYATSLEDQLSLGAYRRYTRRQEESRYLRGKLDMKKQTNEIDKSKFAIEYFRFSPDNDLNRFFAYATGVFRNLTRDTRNLEILSPIESMLASEEIVPANPNAKINFNRLNQRFEIPYTYGRIILDSLLILPGRGKKAMMMLFDMNVVFERFFARFIERNQGVIFAGMDLDEVSPQHSERNFIYNRKARSLRWTQPDLRVTAGGSTYIFDTKYKILRVPDIYENDDSNADEISRISSGDLYQIFAYSELYNALGTVLVFPGTENRVSEPYRFRKDGRLLWVYMLHLDLNEEGWEDKLAKEFKEHFRKIQDESVQSV
jgi:5-methylcytosine-specific restriction enzyme subunit McrC